MAKRYRFMFRFWLDAMKDSETWILDWLEALKQKRQMKPTIIKALRLYFDLGQGNTDVLLELFPGVVDALCRQQETATNEQFARLEALLQNGNSHNGNGHTGPKALQTAPIEAPTFDDDCDEIELSISKDTSIDAGANFVNSMLALQ